MFSFPTLLSVIFDGEGLVFGFCFYFFVVFFWFWLVLFFWFIQASAFLCAVCAS